MPIVQPKIEYSLFNSTACVVTSDSPPSVIEAAMAIKATRGDLVQICDGTADDVQIKAALNDLPSGIFAYPTDVYKRGSVYIAAGTYHISIPIELATGAHLILDKGAILKPSANVNLINMDQGACFTGGTLYCMDYAGYSSTAIEVQPHTSDAQIFRESGFIKDTMIFGRVDADQSGTDGISIHLKAADSKQADLFMIDSVKMYHGSYGLLLSADSPGSACNGNIITNMVIAYQTYPICLNNISNANNVGYNIIEGDIQAGQYMKYAVYLINACNSNKFKLVIHDWEVSNGGSPTSVLYGDSCQFNQFDIVHNANYGYTLNYSNNLVRNNNSDNYRKEEYSKYISQEAKYFFIGETTGDAFLLNQVSIPNYDFGGNNMTLYNSPTFTTKNDLSGMVLNGTTQYGKTDRYLGLYTSSSTVIAFQPNFNYNDGNLHVIHRFHVSAAVYAEIRKTAANNMEFEVKSVATLTCSGSVTFSSGDLLIIVAVVDVDNDTVYLWVNGTLVDTQTDGTFVGDGNRGYSYLGSDNTPANYAGGNYYILTNTGLMDQNEVVRWTDIYANLLGEVVNVGSVNTGVTALEEGDYYNHRTTLTVSQVDALTLADNVAKSTGYKLYTLPPGAIVIEHAYMSMGILAASTEIKTDTPDVGIGTALAAGAMATLDLAGAGSENIITGQLAADCNNTPTVKTIADQVLVIESGDSHSIYFNVADTWADDTGGDLTADIAGTVVLVWKFMV